MKKNLYFAAALFNKREKLFNTFLTRALEKLNYRVFLPQRDGVEFSSFNEIFSKFNIPTKNRLIYRDKIMYLLDIGKFVKESDIVLANLDEPIDEGVVVEIVWSYFMGKPILSYRTEIRSPFGKIDDIFKGTHCFPIFNSNDFLYFSIDYNEKNIENTLETIDNLVTKIDEKIKNLLKTHKKIEYNHPEINKIVNCADILFEGIDSDKINDKESIETIIKRFKENSELMLSIGPKIL